MEDVARRAGVSRSLVSLVMRESPNVSDERRRRVLAAAAELDYSPNAIARGLASRRSGIVAVLLNDLHNPFFAEIYDGLAAEADAAGLRLLVATGRRERRAEQAALDSFLPFRPDGVVLVGPRLPSAAMRTLATTAPVVVIGRMVRADGVDVVMTDEATGAGLVVEHLHRLGHWRIVHVDGGQGAGAAARRRGYVAAMRRAGLAAETDVLAGDFTEQAGRDAATALLRRDDLPTSLFAANDLAAIGAIDTLARAGVDVPGDVSVMGYDNSFFAHLGHISLTTVDQPRAEMGRLAMRLLGERARGQRRAATRRLMTPTLVVRGTTAPPRRP
jgi:DNA-binding LacI/PurR family transcriptional regulator